MPFEFADLETERGRAITDGGRSSLEFFFWLGWNFPRRGIAVGFGCGV